jgi:hypothetical protein
MWVGVPRPGETARTQVQPEELHHAPAVEQPLELGIVLRQVRHELHCTLRVGFHRARRKARVEVAGGGQALGQFLAALQHLGAVEVPRQVQVAFLLHPCLQRLGFAQQVRGRL